MLVTFFQGRFFIYIFPPFEVNHDDAKNNSDIFERMSRLYPDSVVWCYCVN